MLYRHYKGGLYTKLFEAISSDTDSDGNVMVVYLSLTTGKIHTRRRADFHGTVFVNGQITPRFRLIED